MRADPVLAAVIRQVGPCRLAERQPSDHLTALVIAIVNQQLSTKAAATIFSRLVALFPDDAISGVDTIARLDDDRLRGVGLSRQKIGYLRDLCAHIHEGRLRLDELDAVDDAGVADRLTAVKGFGRWTADMFLIFRLHRPDVLPVGDLGIVKAVQRVYRLRTRPDAKRLVAIGESWRPYRSVASWYLWRSLNLERLPARTPVRPASSAKRPATVRPHRR
jgi:DNA-3-methyladenine glycosylase II